MVTGLTGKLQQTTPSIALEDCGKQANLYGIPKNTMLFHSIPAHQWPLPLPPSHHWRSHSFPISSPHWPPVLSLMKAVHVWGGAEGITNFKARSISFCDGRLDRQLCVTSSSVFSHLHVCICKNAHIHKWQHQLSDQMCSWMRDAKEINQCNKILQCCMRAAT